jgi:hypothetical protein
MHIINGVMRRLARAMVMVCYLFGGAADAFLVPTCQGLCGRACIERAQVAKIRGSVHANQKGLRLACMAAKKGAISKAFKKPTGALTVSLEYERMETSTYTENDLVVLSMQLRKIKAASLWTPSLSDVAILTKEQNTAKGDFPGPCPVVYYPPLSKAKEEDLQAAAGAGATAVVLRPDAMTMADAAVECGLEVIWDVRSPEDIRVVVEAGKGTNFLVAGADVLETDLMAALPQDSLTVASVDCQNDEIRIGREAAKAGIKSIVIRQACIGDIGWDLRYGRSAIESLTSKANPEFNIVGMSKGSSGDGRQSYGASAEARAQQDRMSVQKDIIGARGGSRDPFPNHPGSLPPSKTAYAYVYSFPSNYSSILTY